MTNDYSTRSTDPVSKSAYFRRHTDVVKHLESGNGPSVAAITTALDYPEGMITESHLGLCEQIVAKGANEETALSFVLPTPNSEHVAPFAAVAGPDNSQGTGVPGCYLLANAEFLSHPLVPGQTSPCYVGHSTRLGKRVKEHAKGLSATTAPFIKNMGSKASVFLFPVTQDIISQLNGLPLLEFLCVLEQYMFMHYFPAVNKTQVATAGVLQSPQAVAKLRENTGDALHIYTGDETDPSVPLVHVYSYPSMGFASIDLLGYGRLAVRDILRRGGWFRNKLFMSTEIIQSASTNLMLLEDLKSLVNELKAPWVSPMIKPVSVEIYDTTTKETHLFDTKKEAAAFLGCDREAIRPGRTNLYKRRYRITVT